MPTVAVDEVQRLAAGHAHSGDGVNRWDVSAMIGFVFILLGLAIIAIGQSLAKAGSARADAGKTVIGFWVVGVFFAAIGLVALSGR